MSWPSRADRFPFFDDDGRPLAFAHRGGAALPANAGIENSRAAFANAVGLGFRYLETDVHATADGVLVAFHDHTLDRVTDGTGRIHALPIAAVRGARIGGREPIPLFEELLDAWPDVRFNVDCKAAPAVEPLARTIDRHAAWDRVCVASFSQVRLRRLRALLGPRVATSYAPPGLAALRLTPSGSIARRLAGPMSQAAQVPVRAGALRIVTPTFIARAHAFGKHVHVWTVDDSDEMRSLLDLGVDGIMTDRPDRLRDVLAARGQWPGAAAA